MLSGTFRFHLILMRQPAFTLRLKEVKKGLSLLWSKRRFPATSCLRLREKPRKRYVRLGYPRMNLTRLSRMELPGLRIIEMKVVLDTSVLISALISPHNPPDLILQSWLAGDFELLTSEDQLEEIRRVSRYAHLQPFLQAHRVGLLINRIRSLATIVRPGSLISEEALDPDDNFLIAICEAGSANSLVTGDQRAGLLERRHIGATEILTAAQFAERYLGWRVQRS